MKTVGKTEQSDRALNSDDKPESCSCSALPPPEIIDRLHMEINACLDDPKVKARIVELGYLVFKTSQTEFTRFVGESIEKWAKVIRAANVRAE